MEIFNAILVQDLFKFLLICLGITSATLIFKLLDNRKHEKGNNKFEKWIQTASNADLAIFFSARFIGVCILVGFAIS